MSSTRSTISALMTPQQRTRAGGDFRALLQVCPDKTLGEGFHGPSVTTRESLATRKREEGEELCVGGGDAGRH